MAYERQKTKQTIKKPNCSYLQYPNLLVTASLGSEAREGESFA